MGLFQYPYFHIHFAEGLILGFLSVYNAIVGLGGILLFTGYELREYQVKHDADPVSFQQLLLGYTIGALLGWIARRVKRHG